MQYYTDSEQIRTGRDEQEGSAMLRRKKNSTESFYQEREKEFVKAAEKCEYDVDVFYNRVVVDAKSILGVISMDLTRPLTVKYHVEDQDCFEQTLNKFAM